MRQSKSPPRSRTLAWRGRRVLVTGAGGFIGSHLCEALAREGASVHAFLRYTSSRHLGALGEVDSRLLSRMAFHFGDLRQREDLLGAARGCDCAFHLGALIGIPYSYRSARHTFEVNALGTLAVLEVARELGVRRVVHTSTSEVYGSAQSDRMDETHPLSAQSPYAASKTAADQTALSFHRSFGLPVTIVRPFNTYGPRQSPRAVIPTIIQQALAGEVVRLGSLAPIRDFTYVQDTVAGIMALGACEEAVGRVVNLGSGQAISVGDVVATVSDILGKKIRVRKDSARIRPDASEVDRLLCDAGLAWRLARWKAGTSFTEGLRKTVAYFKRAGRAPHSDPGRYAV